MSIVELLVVVFLAIEVARGPDISLIFFPIAVAGIAISRLTPAHGIIKGVIAVWAIAVAGAITGGVARLNAPLNEFGFLYLFIGVTIPLALMGIDDYLLYRKIRDREKKEE